MANSKILERPGPFTDTDSFNAGQGVGQAFSFVTPPHRSSSRFQVKDFLRDQCKILVIGAGGLGCELLMNLALLGMPPQPAVKHI